MSKGLSGLFDRTVGYTTEKIAQELNIRPQESTAEVWKHIEATQEEYPGTVIPRSFVIDTPSGKIWTAPNGTKHMYEALISVKELPTLKNANPNLFAQFILYDYWKSVGQAALSGVTQLRRRVVQGNWEFVFGKRPDDEYPVVFHARFLATK